MSGSPRTRAKMVNDHLFADRMARFNPFERRPVVAVAVSGGGDSMALCRLADVWARARGGNVVALTVDHGLRADSADEARRVGTWLSSLGIDHEILLWQGIKPRARLQEAARAARYRLMRAWCRDHGCLHLLVAHTRDDQAETVRMRRERDSGPLGLSGMSACIEFDDVRVLRPLLDADRETLRQYLLALEQPWTEDPSNRNGRFARVRARRFLAENPGDSEAAVEEAIRAGVARKALEMETATLIARCCDIRPEGYAFLDAVELSRAGRATGGLLLGRLLSSIGGRRYPPSGIPVGELLDWLLEKSPGDSSRTLGGSRIVRSHGKALICRESRNLPKPVPISTGQEQAWDGRFALRVSNRFADSITPEIVPLGRSGWSEIVAAEPPPASAPDTLSGAACSSGDSRSRGHTGSPVPGISAERGLRGLSGDRANRFYPPQSHRTARVFPCLTCLGYYLLYSVNAGVP